MKFLEGFRAKNQGYRAPVPPPPAAPISPVMERAVSRLRRPSEEVREVDGLLIWAIISLVFIGVVMVFSASIAIAEGSRFTQYQPHFFLVRHLAFLGVGVAAGLMAFRIPMHLWKKYAFPLFVFGALLLMVVLLPGVGREVNGAQRWIGVGPINLQPSELMKIFIAIFAADYTVRKHEVMGSFRYGFLPLTLMLIVITALLLSQPDFGAVVVISCIAFGILFLGGVNIRIFAVLIVIASAALAILIWISPYRRERLFGFMDPWQDAFGRGYQLSHSLIAFGRGEWFGVGLGGSVEKLFYLPEAHTDFLLAVIAEELGFAGVLVIIGLFALLVQRAFVIGQEAIKLDRVFSGLVAQGIGVWFGIQSFINMGVNMGLLPTKGLTLPLMSFGGSSLLANFIGLAILLRVDWEVRQLKRKGGGF